MARRRPPDPEDGYVFGRDCGPWGAPCCRSARCDHWCHGLAEQQPRHGVCYEVARGTVERYLNETTVFSPRTPCDDYPLAATVDAYLARAADAHWSHVAEWYAAVVRLGFSPRLPLDGEQYILAVIRREFPSGNVARVFAMVDLTALRRLGDAPEWLPCSVTGRHTVVEGDVTAPELVVVRQVHTWFDRYLLGRRIGGRPPGPADGWHTDLRDRGTFLAVVGEAVRALHAAGRATTQEQVCAAMASLGRPPMDPATLRYYTNRVHGFAGHRALVAAVLAEGEPTDAPAR